MAHFHIKKKKGRPYLYVREISRVNGKPKVISQVYVGSPDRVAQLAKGEKQLARSLKTEEFGALWLAQQINNDFCLESIVDSVVQTGAREKGPSVGEYFLYCVWNRMIKAVSKRRLGHWYDQTAIQQIRAVNTKELNSQRYWEKWERVNEEDLKKISNKFFRRLWDIQTPDADCFLFDTTNYYTFMSSQTDSDLAQRGRNKEGRHNLRQVGLGLLVSRGLKLPLYYSVYPGNIHDSKHFKFIMDEMFGVICSFNEAKENLTLVIDKGMNSEDNYSFIDKHKQMHFVTTYSTYFAQEIAMTPLEEFKLVDTKKNRKLIKQERINECMLAYRTKGKYWGKERSVVVTYSPKTAQKKEYAFFSKITKLRQELLEMQLKVRKKAPHWKNPETIKTRYNRLCASLHISSTLFDIDFKKDKTSLKMSFRKNERNVKKKQSMFGKNIIITDNKDWSTGDIIEASLDRWQVEEKFRQSKNEDFVGVGPIRHWTDSKIRCHLFTCVVAMVYLRMIELKLSANGVNRSAEEIMDDMQHLHSILHISKQGKPLRQLETPNKTQTETLKAFGFYIDARGVLQKISR